MPSIEAPSPEALSAIFQAAQLAVLVLAAFVAWRQVSEARQLREEQARPFVVVDFEIDHDGLIYVVVSNLGRTIARDVRLTFKPEPHTTLDRESDPEDPPFREAKILREGIPSLAPGKRIPAMFDFGMNRVKKKDRYPDVYEVTVEYRDSTGRRLPAETNVLDLGIYWNVLRIGGKDIGDIHKSLQTIGKHLASFAAPMGDGILAVSDRDVRARVEKRRRAIEERRAQRAAEEAPEDADATPPPSGDPPPEVPPTGP